MPTNNPPLTKNKAFCILPFIHLHINENNDVKLCCLADKKTVKKYTKDFNFVNDPDFVDVRKKMLAGEKVEHCTNCYEIDDGGAESLRVKDTLEWFRKLKISTIEEVPTQVMYYDIRNDNLCNLSCRMCSPQFSSQIEKEYKTIGWTWTEPPKSFGFNSIVDLATVKKIYCAGGEPSLMPEFRTFLSRAVEAGRTDIEILMNTNATNLNKEYLELLTKFDTVRIVCSIDGFAEVNKYIRWPADWATITKNIQGIANMTPWLGFNITISIWNIAKLSLLVTFLETNWPNARILLNHVMNPPAQMFTNFPDVDVVLDDLEKLRITTSYSREESFRNKVEYYINKVKTNTLNVDNLVKFFEYNDTLDKSRGVELRDYIPELEACRRFIPVASSNT